MHTQDPIEQSLVEEDTVLAEMENVREEDSPSWHGEVGVQKFINGSMTYAFRRSRKHRKRMGLEKEAMMGIDQERASCNVRLRILLPPRQSVKDSCKLFHPLKKINWL
jgi:hypothetical protein